MLFNSTVFIFVFFPATLFLFFLFANVGESHWRKHFIIVASLFFYSQWDVTNLLVIFLSIAFNYAVSLKLRCEGNNLPSVSAKRWLALGITLNIALLFYFKYVNFFLATWGQLTGIPVAPLNIVLPLGISFFTFQQIIYIYDLYKGRTCPANFIDYVVCVCFFPHLIAGPIIKYRNLLPQLASPLQCRVHAPYLASGICFFTLGLAKKLLLADSLAPFADTAFTLAGNGSALSTLMAWTGALAYTLQLYFDFSGYSDMAVGLGLCFGIELPVNFNSPYKAVSVVDFWRRWHITLSQFLRDYLYIPLGGNRLGPFRHSLNLMLTMFLGGLWHGAGWTFMLWGLLHGAALCVNHWWRVQRLPGYSVLERRRVLGQIATMLFVVLAWVPFRAESLGASLVVWKAMAGCNQGFALAVPVPLPAVFWLVLGVGVAVFAPNSQEIMGRFRSRFELYSIPDFGKLRWSPSFAWALVAGVVFFVTTVTLSTGSKFLYFDF